MSVAAAAAAENYLDTGGASPDGAVPPIRRDERRLTVGLPFSILVVDPCYGTAPSAALPEIHPRPATQAAQNGQIWIARRLIGIEPTPAHIGGSRTMAATSDRHVARLVFQSASVPIADYLRDAGSIFRWVAEYRSPRFVRSAG